MFDSGVYNMNAEQQQKLKRVSLIFLIFFIMLLSMNTNNNPNPIIQRIFRPIHSGNSNIYYSGIILLLLMYFLVKELYKEWNISLLNTGTKRIIVIILISYIFSSASQYGVKLYKSLSGGLNSIYCYRNNSNIFRSTVQNETHVICSLKLENCSSKVQKFYVKVRPKVYNKEIDESDLAASKMLILNPHEKQLFSIPLYKGDMSYSCSGDDFGFTLYNKSDEAKFTWAE